MLLTTVAVGLILQSPQDMKTWVDRGFDPARPNAYSVAGVPELSRKEAWASVSQRALEDRRERLSDLAERQAEATSASWLPGFLKDRVVRDWTQNQLLHAKPEVVDRDLLVRDHGFGQSFQAFMLLDQVDPAIATRSGGLNHRLQRAERRFLTRCGCTVGLWGVLALILCWVDRLSRGYMTGRLFVIGGLLGLCGPILLVLM